MRFLLSGLALATIVIGIGGYCSLRGQDKGNKLRVYYYPIGAETLTSINGSNIEEKGSRCDIISLADVRAIKKVLDSATRPAPQKFTDLAVRVKVLEIGEKGETLLALVENDGLVKFPAGEDAMISQKGMNTLKKVIEAQFK